MIRRFLGLVGATPMQQVVAEVERRGVVLRNTAALEVFGFTGEFHTRDYASVVRSLEVWEIDPSCEERLRLNLPGAHIRIVDSYQACREVDGKFGFIVVDNPMSTYGEHCEHFGLFPDLLRIAESSVVLVLNVIPSVDKVSRQKYPQLFTAEHLRERERFYLTGDAECVTIESMLPTYVKHATDAGFSVDWWFWRRRSVVFYLVLKMSRSAAAGA